jgi:hypothetical protein
MDLKKHFNSYRESLHKDALEGCIEYARKAPTASPVQYPTVYDYLNYARGCAAAAAETDNADAYESWLKGHQKAMTALFERMVDEEIKARGGYEPSKVFEMASLKGWNWFKFADKSLAMKLNVSEEFAPFLLWIPRYAEKFAAARTEAADHAVFDADELRLIFHGKPGPEVVHAVIKHKLANPNIKFLTIRPGPEVSFKALDKINTGETVLDWALPLFSQVAAS